METFEEVLQRLAARTAAPGGGTAAAWARDLGAALAEMAAAYAEDLASAARAGDLWRGGLRLGRPRRRTAGGGAAAGRPRRRGLLGGSRGPPPRAGRRGAGRRGDGRRRRAAS